MNELENKLRQKIVDSLEYGQGENEASWGMETGVLISRKDAKDLLTEIENLKAENNIQKEELKIFMQRENEWLKKNDDLKREVEMLKGKLKQANDLVNKIEDEYHKGDEVEDLDLLAGMTGDFMEWLNFALMDLRTMTENKPTSPII